MNNDEFERLIAEAYEKLPVKIKEKMKNVAIMVEDLVDTETVHGMNLDSHMDLLGLYRGVPQTEREHALGIAFPDTITLYKLPILEEAEDSGKSVYDVVYETLWHEVAHHFGLSEEDVMKRENEVFGNVRVRSSGVVMREGEILLMHRRKKGREFYAFPGGGVEKGETNIEACEREIMEETSVKVKVDRLILEAKWSDGISDAVFLCSYVSGEPNLPADSIEAKRMSDPEAEQFYEPVWMPVSKCSDLLIYPLEIKDEVLSYLDKGFPNKPRAFFLDIAKRRTSL